MRNNHSRHALLLVLCVVLILGGSANAQVPDRLNYQGILTDSTGSPVPDGTYDMRFCLFNDETGDSQLDWNSPDGEEQSVQVLNGVYNIQLGAVVPLNADIFSEGAAWLEISIYEPESESWETLSPRQEITSVPYALKAGTADTLAGQSLADLDATYINTGESSVITTHMIRDNSITASELATDAVATDEIAEGAVTSTELADSAVTADKLAANSVNSTHIIDGSVTSDDLADDYVSTTGGAISGEKTGYLFSVGNNSTDDSARGIYARGHGYGLYAEETGDGDVGIYSPDFIVGGGFRSISDSYHWIPGTMAVKGDRPNSLVTYGTNGSCIIQKTSDAGLANIFLPLSLPGNLFGQNVVIEEVRVYYTCSSSGSYITSTWLNKQTGASSYEEIAKDLTDHTSTTDHYFNLTPSSYEIDANQGILNMHVYLYFENTSDMVRIGGVRVRLGHK